MHHARRRATSRVVVALALFMALACTALTGCASQGASAKSGSTVLKIGDPGNSGLLAYAKKSGVLEERLKAAGATVEWGGTYASFTATIDAVRSGDVNVLEGAISPAIGYLSTSDDIKIFAVAPRTTDRSAPIEDGLVVRADSPVTSIKELVGKKIAVNKGGRGEYLLNLALDKAGIAHDAVEKVYLNPQQAAGAFNSGKIDAWWAIVRGYPTAVAQGAKTIVASRDVGDNDLTILAARNEVVEQNPKALKALVDTLAELNAQARKEPEKFQNVFTDAGPTATTGAALKRDIAVERAAQPFAPVADADVKTVQVVADYFVKTGLISRPVRADSAVARLN